MGAAATTGCDDELRESSHGSNSCKATPFKKVGQVQVAATEILKFAGFSAYHTSVVIGEKEYYFDSQGIICAPAMWSHVISQGRRPPGFQTELFNVGITTLGPKDLVKGLFHHFAQGSYDVICKNCNSFTDVALYFLTGARLDGRYSRCERFLAATRPVSTTTINQLIQWAVESNAEGATKAELEQKTWARLYSTNPLAEDFNIEHVIADIDKEYNTGDECRGKRTGVCVTCSITPWCGRQTKQRAPALDDSPSRIEAVDVDSSPDIRGSPPVHARESSPVLNLDSVDEADDVETEPEVADEASGKCRPPSERQVPTGQMSLRNCNEPDRDAEVWADVLGSLDNISAIQDSPGSPTPSQTLGAPRLCSEDVQYL